MAEVPPRPAGPWPGVTGAGTGDGQARPLGGRVRRGGIALVKRGEMVMPLEGTEAELALAEQDGRHDIHVHLPVTVEVVGSPDRRLVHEAVDEALRRVRHAMDAHAERG
ncbi:hypothetical protein [Streptomyces rhizosphaericus]|uniref:Uncharacterized protein n=1 Tax=Streptomyces rhizosphaericus TaxID=114699 RepID=A0A6G4ABL5_9ACTN|nr:hypothetical protein [Streptomyces rhizosphaericus]NEW69877.1 hypothetical protein [Streptomyces rhizosphaericus]